MSEFFFRTEDLQPDEVLSYFVETQQDRQIVNALKNRNPTILVGSRGVGKSFLLRVAQKELLDSFDDDRIFPVYLSFVRSSLISTVDPTQFKHWMLARITATIIRSLSKAGLLGAVPKSVKLLAGDTVSAEMPQTAIEKLADAYEDSWKSPGKKIDGEGLLDIDQFRDAMEDLSEEINVKRFVLLIDEAAHIFLPEQQRQFFTLFRDMRSPNITCNAAVYPGVTSFGDSFQPAHDATMLHIDRDVLHEKYVENMREIVEKQADSSFLKSINNYKENFAILAYAASGNPRILLKTVSSAPKLNSTEVNDVVRNYYRSDIWAEHSLLADKYVGHKEVIDWGRVFVESSVLPDIKAKNDVALASDKATSAYFWVSREVPAVIKEALRVLAYTGILNEQDAGIKASRSQIGQRYVVNLGCLFALEQTPTSTAFEIARNLTPKRMTEFGANHSTYKSLADRADSLGAQEPTFILERQLDKPISVLEISNWQKEKLSDLKLNTVRDVLGATEEKLKEAMYVGPVRARQMRNAAVSAVLEYLSG